MSFKQIHSNNEMSSSHCFAFLQIPSFLMTTFPDLSNMSSSLTKETIEKTTSVLKRDLGIDLNEDDWNKAINSINSFFICNGLRENTVLHFS